MDGFLPIFFLLVVLKIPVLAAIWLVFWAGKPPETAFSEDDSGGAGPNRWNPSRPRPRGPHGEPFSGGAKPRVRLSSSTRKRDSASPRRNL